MQIPQGFPARLFPTPSKTMNLEEFEVQYQAAIDDLLNQMQTVVLLLSCAETKTVEIGNSLQSIRQMTESFFVEQRRRSTLSAGYPPLDKTVAMRTEPELRQVPLQSQR